MFKKIILITLSIFFAVLSFSCNQAGDKSALPKNDASGKPPFTKDAKPVPDSEVAVIEMENAVFGKVTIELYPNVAPKMVERFKQLIKEGAYDGTAFHRINETVVQGGDPLSKTNDPKVGSGKSGKPNVPAEFSDIPYETGIVGAARLGNDINSQDCQFFIMLRREAQFDKSYTVFGKVIDGMTNVRTISGVKPKEGERPVEPVRIKTVTLQPHP
jgi:cyclophilin family peptidyl-prolyl cis-trans isomerase